jgi:hypothetical protein
MAIGRAVPGARSIVGRWRRFRRCASTGTARDDSEAGKTLLETIEVKTGLSAKSDELELRCDEESISAGSGADFARKELTRPAGYVTSPSRQSPFCLTVSLAPVVREYVLGS